MDRQEPDATLIGLTADIVAAHVANNAVSIGDVAQLIGSTYGALAALGVAAQAEQAKPEPAVSIRSSIKPDSIACLECGKRQKMLKRHINDAHGLSPEGYRAKWGLNADYPMTAPNYAEHRRTLAKRIGLGSKANRAGSGSTHRTGTK